MNDVWAALPVKGFASAKQRLGSLLSSSQREALAAAMLEDVLAALVGARLAGIMVNTLDPCTATLARRYGARVVTETGGDGHTAAVAGMQRILTREKRTAMLALPGDIPQLTVAEIDAVVATCRDGRSLVIAPAHDELGSNAVLCQPPNVMPLRFGDDSYFPHLETARRHGLEPGIVRAAGIGMDIDHPADLRALLAARPRIPTRTATLLACMGL